MRIALHWRRYAECYRNCSMQFVWMFIGAPNVDFSPVITFLALSEVRLSWMLYWIKIYLSETKILSYLLIGNVRLGILSEKVLGLLPGRWLLQEAIWRRTHGRHKLEFPRAWVNYLAVTIYNRGVCVKLEKNCEDITTKTIRKKNLPFRVLLESCDENNVQSKYENNSHAVDRLIVTKLFSSTFYVKTLFSFRTVWPNGNYGKKKEWKKCK